MNSSEKMHLHSPSESALFFVVLRICINSEPLASRGPVWVYVLERRRAVEVLNTLMGDRDPGVAQREAPNSLRALYGLSLEQNGLMGSPDPQTAEIQVASLFASSPPFPTSELPDDKYGSMRSDVSSSYLSALRRTTSDEGYAPSNVTNPSTVGGGSNGRLNTNGNPHFRARAIPSTHINPDIQPRTTRAAALRAGVVIDKTTSTPRAPLSKERLAKTFANVPGHKRAESIAVASTAAPVIAPRMTRAAALRLGKEAAPTPTTKRIASSKNTKNTFDGVPGHKRSETISVASVLAPTVAPRLNKSASLRARGEAAPPTSFMCTFYILTNIDSKLILLINSPHSHNSEASWAFSEQLTRHPEPTQASNRSSSLTSLLITSCRCPSIIGDTRTSFPSFKAHQRDGQWNQQPHFDHWTTCRQAKTPSKQCLCTLHRAADEPECGLACCQAGVGECRCRRRRTQEFSGEAACSKSTNGVIARMHASLESGLTWPVLLYISQSGTPFEAHHTLATRIPPCIFVFCFLFFNHHLICVLGLFRSLYPSLGHSYICFYQCLLAVC